jgi:hypothetical protein
MVYWQPGGEERHEKTKRGRGYLQGKAATNSLKSNERPVLLHSGPKAIPYV